MLNSQSGRTSQQSRVSVSSLSSKTHNTSRIVPHRNDSRPSSATNAIGNIDPKAYDDRSNSANINGRGFINHQGGSSEKISIRTSSTSSTANRTDNGQQTIQVQGKDINHNDRRSSKSNKDIDDNKRDDSFSFMKNGTENGEKSLPGGWVPMADSVDEDSVIHSNGTGNNLRNIKNVHVQSVEVGLEPGNGKETEVKEKSIQRKLSHPRHKNKLNARVEPEEQTIISTNNISTVDNVKSIFCKSRQFHSPEFEELYQRYFFRLNQTSVTYLMVLLIVVCIVIMAFHFSSGGDFNENFYMAIVLGIICLFYVFLLGFIAHGFEWFQPRHLNWISWAIFATMCIIELMDTVGRKVGLPTDGVWIALILIYFIYTMLPLSMGYAALCSFGILFIQIVTTGLTYGLRSAEYSNEHIWRQVSILVYSLFRHIDVIVTHKYTFYFTYIAYFYFNYRYVILKYSLSLFIYSQQIEIVQILTYSYRL